MKYSIAEQLAKAQNKRRRRTDPVDNLQTRLWLESIFHDFKISRQELDRLLSGDSESSGCVLKWLKGEHSATQITVKQVKKLLPGSNHIYDLPIFHLLKNKPLSKAYLKKVIAPYLSESTLPIWNFPITQNGIPDGLPAPTTHLLDTETLFQRGDLYGFMGILYLARKAEAENDHEGHILFIKEAYRALPGLCRYRYFRRRWGEFYNALLYIHCRMPASAMMVMPKIATIQMQVESKEHITLRHLRPRDPISYRFTDLDLPYLEARFFP